MPGIRRAGSFPRNAGIGIHLNTLRNPGVGDKVRAKLREFTPSDRHLRADLHHASGRNLEEAGRVRGIAGETDEQLVLPERHA